MKCLLHTYKTEKIPSYISFVPESGCLNNKAKFVYTLATYKPKIKIELL